jgi:hypothetical protein
MTVSAEVPGFMADLYLVDRLWLAPKNVWGRKGIAFLMRLEASKVATGLKRTEFRRVDTNVRNQAREAMTVGVIS